MIMSVPNKRKATPCLFPGYKWCGPGCSGPGCPVNDVDCCCKYHDLCYEDYGSCRSCESVQFKRKTGIRHVYLYAAEVSFKTI
ncbi:hypothetical protein ACQCPQ_10490 [Priestia megaterium]|uniref:hypothetical protein n=1 Tax=Priestia megaterium TaxID=1404 RepID=UPI003D015941